MSPKVVTSYYWDPDLLERLDAYVKRLNEQRGKQSKISRNEIISKAIERYLEEVERGEVQQNGDG